jgi:hypothetical protein
MNWPTTIDDAVKVVINTLTPDQRNDIRNLSKADLIGLHHSVGQWIRNEFGLWQGNFKLVEICGALPFDADEASAVIIEKVWEELKKNEE